MNANPYLLIGARLGVPGTDPLLHRLADWHDAMVAHERARRYESCDDECPHAQARQLWKEAVNKFGRGANELVFLRSRASQLRKAA
jgi:hypothetical protein